MDEMIGLNSNGEVSPINEENTLLEVTQGLLEDARTTLDNKKTMSVPIAQLSILGAGASSLIPALNTVKQTTTIATDGLYTLANAGIGDVLKVAKNGNFWGALKTTNGAPKLAQLQPAGPISTTAQTVAALNPATMMMAVALFSIEQELGKIEDMQKQILSFLEIEKESQIEADVESLVEIIRKYKDNWDNERFVSGNHTQVLTYQNRARKNMLSYKKGVTEIIRKKRLIVVQTNVKHTLTDLKKKFKYYQLSLYTFSLSSLMEIMLSGNFKESYIAGIKDEIQEMSESYRSLFDESSSYIEEMGGSALEANVLKRCGMAGKAVGKFIGSVPLIKKGSVDEFLQSSGERLRKNAAEMEKEAVHHFATINDPGTGVLMDKMEDMIQIYNHTTQICFDKEKIYLVSDEPA